VSVWLRMIRRRSHAQGCLPEVEALYRRSLPELRRVAAAVSGDREAAPDIVQEAFARAVQRLGTFSGRGPLEAWVWRIVVNTARNHRRDTPRHEELPSDLAHEVNGGARSDAAGVAAAVGALPERQRLVLFLRYYADLDYGSIAHALDISPGTVGATLTAARSALQQLLSNSEAVR
jgi:RNA polymerase sigma-70 factor (ECF subfamily)